MPKPFRRMLSRRLSVWPLLLLVIVLSASAVGSQASAVRPGISVLVGDSLHLIRGKRVGLITNQTGRDERGRRSIDLIHDATGVRLTAIFSPEHGIRGIVTGGERVRSSIDRETGV